MALKIAIIGAGNGGQAMAGHFAYLGHKVNLYTRDISKIPDIVKNKGILIKESVNGFGELNLITDKIDEAVKEAEIIMVTTVANAHRSIALKLVPCIQDNQIVVLNPGRTFGAVEFSNILKQQTEKRVYIAETQSLLYACRAEGNGEVRIIGIKSHLPVAAFPCSDTDYVISKLNRISDSFIKAKNILETSLDNIGCMFHPAIVMFNAANIERGETFYFYNDMSPSIADFLEEIDKERLAVGKALGINLRSVNEWISFSYEGITGETLCEKMKNNPAYYKILAPPQLDSRLLTEDIPTGILPLIEIGKLLNVPTPLLNSVYHIISSLLKTDFTIEGRTLKNLGIENDLKKLTDNI